MRLSGTFLLAGTCALFATGCPLLLDDEFSVGSALGAGGREAAHADGGGLDLAATSIGNSRQSGDPESLKAALVHRYAFDGVGSQATDSVGGAHATLVNTTLTGNGTLELAGGDSDQYVDLPNGILGRLENVTLETWLVWRGGNGWQRIFDFGTSTRGEGNRGAGESYVFLTPKSNVAGANDFMRLSYTVAGYDAEVTVDGTAALPSGTLVVVAAVLDDQNNRMQLYLNGELQQTSPFAGQLHALADNNDWIGRSQYTGDDSLAASILEFRIYAAALAASQLRTSFAAGPDAAFLQR